MIPPHEDPDRTAAHAPPPAAGPADTTRGLSTSPHPAGGESPEVPDAFPATVGRFELGDELARGGMGVVYRAREPSIGREVAVKLIHDRFRGDPGSAARFLAEARITGQLQHPGVPPVFEVGTLPDGSPFLAMKLIEGRTLDQLLKRRPDPSYDRGRFLAIFEQVCQAVGYAHSRRVVHRDLKPANVMVGAFGEVQVMDWGLAKVLEGAGELAPAPGPRDGPAWEVPAAPGADPDRTTGHPGEGPTDDRTRAGQAMGTPAYMPPEQARGEPDRIDRRSDVFALGGVLCTILTGKPPHTGASALEVLRRAAAADPADALRRLAGCGADPDLVALCERCLAADPDDRPRDAGEVAGLVAAYRAAVEDRLRRAEVDRAAAVARAEEQRKRFRLRLALTAAVLLVVAGAAAGGWWYDRVREARRAEQAAAAAEHDRRRDETRRDVIAALSQVDGLLAQTAGLAARPHQWEAAVASARAAAGQAEGVLNSGEPTDELRAAVAEADRTRKFVGRLATLIAGQTDRLGRRKPDAEYLAAFREAGLDPDRMPPAEFGEKVRRHPHAEILATALWDWGTSGGPERARYRYLSTAYVPLRKAFHLPKDLTREGAAAWADGLDPRTLSPARLALLALEAERLNRAAARRALEKAVDQYPDDYLLQTLLANRYFAEKPRRLGEAARHFAAAVALWPRSSSAWSNLGMVLTEQKDFPRAVAYLRHAIDLDPTNHLAYGNLGGALGDSGDKAGALDAYRKAVEFAQTDATAYYNLGVGLRENGEHDAALAAFRRAVVFDPRLAEAHHNIGIELKRRDDPEGAAAEFRAALEIEPDSLTSLSMLGNVLTILGDPEGARAALRRAVELYPDDADARATLGTANLYSGRFAEAIADLRAARKLPPGPDPQYNHERIDDSIGLAEELVRLEKRLPKVLSGEEKTDPEQLPMFVILCHNFKQMHAAAARLCDRWVKAKGLVNHDLSGIRVLATKAALKAGFGLGADPPPPAQRAEFLHMALRFAEAELFTWGLLAQLRADEFRDDAHKRFGAWLADRDLRVTRHWLGLVWFPPDDRAKWAAFWKRVAEQREKTAAKP